MDRAARLALARPPPTPLVAVLPSKVVLVIVREPLCAAMPPASWGTLSEIAQPGRNRALPLPALIAPASGKDDEEDEEVETEEVEEEPEALPWLRVRPEMLTVEAPLPR